MPQFMVMFLENEGEGPPLAPWGAIQWHWPLRRSTA
jgi:hypothetical protein